MATNGVVSVRKNGQVVMKISVGTDGNNAAKVARAIRAMNRVPTIDEANKIASENEFGTGACRVVVTKNNLNKFTGKMELYKSKFHDPGFNPRWECGISDHVEIVDF